MSKGITCNSINNILKNILVRGCGFYVAAANLYFIFFDYLFYSYSTKSKKELSEFFPVDAKDFLNWYKNNSNNTNINNYLNDWMTTCISKVLQISGVYEYSLCFVCQEKRCCFKRLFCWDFCYDFMLLYLEFFLRGECCFYFWCFNSVWI